jgi:1-acyl-sn-glycerol-3-phosphate acyltransferase
LNVATDPRYSRLAMRAFMAYVRPYLRRHFNAVRTRGAAGLAAVPTDAPLLVYANHPGWWDPLVFFLLREHYLPTRELYGPMAEDALARYGIFRSLGLFGVPAQPFRAARAFLTRGGAALARPRSSLWVTAEGEFRDPRERPLRLRRGIAALIVRHPQAWILPLGIEYCFWSERLPEVLVQFGRPECAADLLAPEASTEAALSCRLECVLDELAVAARARAPESFEVALAGRSGVGGPYDLWRRARWRISGAPHSTAHAQPRP